MGHTEWKDIEEQNRDDFVVSSGSCASGMTQMANKLRTMGYFIAPAAKTHHGANIGGLYRHCKQVAMELSKITIKMELEWKRPQSPIIIGLLHDICKVYDYDIILDQEAEGGYRIEYNKKKDYPGHGEASLLIIYQEFVTPGDLILTEEEAMCIRYYMGAFAGKEEWEFYSRAVKKYPNILWTHTADMIASQIKDT